VRRARMDIQPHPRHRSGHGRTSSSSWGQPEPNSPARQTPARRLRPSTPTVNPDNETTSHSV
jgi:hypothetical protein